MNENTSQRRYDIDWLRVIAILAIFIYHCTRFFDTDDWSIKNPTTYVFVDVWKTFATSWGMPLILLISGASAFYALGKFSPGKYVKGLLVRLFVPLVVGIFTHAAFQVYLERLHKREYSGSFILFYPHYFDGMYGLGGNFAWMGLHLWYLEALFIFSLLCLPLFLFFKKSGIGKRILQAVADFLALPGAVFLLALPAIWLIQVLDPGTWGKKDLGGWSVVIYPLFFIIGFVIASNRRLQERIQAMRWLSLCLGLVLTGAYLFAEFTSRTQFVYVSGFKTADLLVSPVAWCCLLVVLGFGMKHLSFTNPFLKYANEAVLPFYILHQTVIVCLGYFVVSWAIPDLLKFLFILPASFLVSLGLYEYLVRRVHLLRFLFGMKVLPRSKAAMPGPADVIQAARLSS
jgi:glucans biosynthesis protein C